MLTDLIHHIVSFPGVYDIVQKLAGRDQNYKWLAQYLAESSGTVLDVGGGTGELARILSPTARYIWLDNDGNKLKGLRHKNKGARALLGNASQIGLKDNSVDVAVCVAVSHHLTDVQFGDTLRELARVCRFKLIFLDAIRHQGVLSRLLWKYDRGSYPRSVEELRSHIERHFVIETEARNSIYHHYWLCAAIPRAPKPEPRSQE